MPKLSHIDPGSAALLLMDYQVDTLTKFMIPLWQRLLDRDGGALASIAKAGARFP
jgi:hypothetical protein